jgi:hypothetical protein
VTNIEYRRRMRHKYQRNKRRRERLMAAGLTEWEAKAIIAADGRAFALRYQARQQAEAAERRAQLAAEEQRYPTQPREAQSVYAVPVPFESSRRRH